MQAVRAPAVRAGAISRRAGVGAIDVGPEAPIRAYCPVAAAGAATPGRIMLPEPENEISVLRMPAS